MLILYAILTCLMIAVTLSDIARYRIPNWLVLALVALYPIAVYISPSRPDWKMACLIALVTFIVGLILLMPFMGGGDIKLLTACALYVNEGAGLDFIVYVAIFGGIGSVLLLLLRAFTPYIFMKMGAGADKIPRVLSDKEPVPYGVAIALAFLLILWGDKMPGLKL